MERDTRRDRGQWRGCHTFKDIVCDGDRVSGTSRSGGLKMGETYYYYYELDGSTETYDTTRPTTSACPFLPGQTVNTLEVPLERSLRSRSASMNSLRGANFKTMDPRDRFRALRPAPPLPAASDLPSTSFSDTMSARSISPAPSWASAARRLFGLRPSSRDGEHGRLSRGSDPDYTPSELGRSYDRAGCVTPSGSVRSRDMSPESLRRFLSEDVPFAPPATEPSPKLWIPDEIVEENEDDDNFATSAASESAPVTLLSPPPFQRTIPPLITSSKNESTTTIVPRPSADIGSSVGPKESLGLTSDVGLEHPQSHFVVSTTSPRQTSPTSRSIESKGRSSCSFLDDSDDDDYDDNLSSNEDEFYSPQQAGANGKKVQPRRTPFTNYSLPYHTAKSNKHFDSHPQPNYGSPALVARNDNGVPVGNTNLLSLPSIDSGLDDLANEISWIADVIRPRDL
ncbi:hypothetical protein DL771_008664 [Monosporascus sp. 5C6A]|nr:hypothetical protein DL771_008664 [Monosporascus sp. 5C6A]